MTILNDPEKNYLYISPEYNITYLMVMREKESQISASYIIESIKGHIDKRTKTASKAKSDLGRTGTRRTGNFCITDGILAPTAAVRRSRESPADTAAGARGQLRQQMPASNRPPTLPPNRRLQIPSRLPFCAAAFSTLFLFSPGNWKYFYSAEFHCLITPDINSIKILRKIKFYCGHFSHDFMILYYILLWIRTNGI